MVKITFIRHAESEFNKFPTLDKYDCDITENGKEQAKKLDGNYDILILSPLKRCYQTFIESNINAKNIHISELVREVRTNKCDFIKGEDIKEETEEEVLYRIELFKEYIKKLNNIKTICVISHADFIWYYSSYVKDGERFGKWLDNCESLTYDQ